MISYEKFKQLKEMQAIGTSQSEINRKVEIGRREIEKWYDKGKEIIF